MAPKGKPMTLQISIPVPFSFSVTKEIQQELKENKLKLFQLKFENSSGKLKNPQKILYLRRDIARMNTILNEKKAEKQ